MLQQLRSFTVDQQLIVGNGGPEPSFAPYVNGWVFECVNAAWSGRVYGEDTSPNSASAAAGWRRVLDTYKSTQAIVKAPRTNVVEGCGPQAKGPGITGNSAPTTADVQSHRFTMGTALLGDGFYWYDLHGNVSAPLWFDEYSVDSSGNAVEDRAKKGYLGQALSDATELTSPGSLILAEDFEAANLPPSFAPAGGVSVTHSAGEVITGAGSLVVSNPDHTKQGYVSANVNPSVPLTPVSSYLLTFDWRVLETLDGSLSVGVFGHDGHDLTVYNVPGTVAVFGNDALSFSRFI